MCVNEARLSDSATATKQTCQLYKASLCGNRGGLMVYGVCMCLDEREKGPQS